MVELVDSNQFHIFPVSDLHFGSHNYNSELFEKWKMEFESINGDKVIYLLGDLLEFPTIKVDGFSSNMSTEDAINQVVEMFEPYKEWIRFVVSGNHELRGKKEFNLDVTKILSKQFNAKYSRNDLFDTIRINGKEYVVYGKHGTSTSKYPDLAMKNFKIDMGNVDANLYLQGHNHYCESSQKFQRDNNGGYLKSYCFTGHFMDYKDSYAHNKGMFVSPPAFMRISIDRDLNTNFKKFSGRCKV